MPYTRLAAETVLIGPDARTGRRGNVAAAVPLYSSTAVPGTLPALAGPITRALRACGVEPADPSNPADADFVNLPAYNNQRFEDIADLCLLEACLGNWAEYDEQVNGKRQDKGKFGDRLMAELAEARANCKALHGYGLSSPVVGSVDLGFASSDPCYYS